MIATGEWRRGGVVNPNFSRLDLIDGQRLIFRRKVFMGRPPPPHRQLRRCFVYRR
jgi:hypothetical protein